MSDHVFISHASADDGFVKELRVFLESKGIPVWVDSRNLRGGDELSPEITQAIEQARRVIGVFGPQTINSTWVPREIELALQVATKRKSDGYSVIPIMLPGIEPTALRYWFKSEPLGVKVALGTGGLSAAAPQLASALGLELPDDVEPPVVVPPPRIEELRLTLSDPVVETIDGKPRVKATAQAIYIPADGADDVKSRRFAFTAPLGPIENDDLRWYLEDYFRWPMGLFADRAEQIELRLPEWGRVLHDSALAPAAAREAVTAWRNAANDAERRFTVEVDSDLPEGASPLVQQAAREAACQLFSLPWELLHDDRGYLFQGAQPVGVRRRVPRRKHFPRKPVNPPIRVLLVSPRPEDSSVAYFDHRSIALPLVAALESQGDLVDLSVLAPPTFPALRQALDDAHAAGRPFHVIHFDGHGASSAEHGPGALCFEDPEDVAALEFRRSKIIPAGELAGLVRDHRIPVIFLEACETAQSGQDVAASVAGLLLEDGVNSVVSMSHSVLVATALRFVGAFYEQLCQGATIGRSMLAGRKALADNRRRDQIPGAGSLNLHDWFVPVLYQDDHDPQLFNRLPPDRTRRVMQPAQPRTLGGLPEPPPHQFVGRSRELLSLERLLSREPYAVVVGSGGEGKTTLAVELARWLVRSERFSRSTFVSVQNFQDVRALIESIGRQLLPQGASWSVAQFKHEDDALQYIDRALRDNPTVLVFDSLENILPDRAGQTPPAAVPFAGLFELARRLLEADGRTRVIFTSREWLPAPFGDPGCTIRLGSLSQTDALELVAGVVRRAGLRQQAADQGGTAEEILELVDSVGRHARALTLLTGEVVGRGVRATTAIMHSLMAALDRRYPDDRERSLFASVELSLNRLTPATREMVRSLAVFHGGVFLWVLNDMLGGDDTDIKKASTVFDELIEVGLGEYLGGEHLRIDPALPAYLLQSMAPDEHARILSRWVPAMRRFVGFLAEQQSLDAVLESNLTLLELSNLLALLDWVRDKETPDEVVMLATALERLVSWRNRPQALARIVAVRHAAAARLADWGYARALSAQATIDRLLDADDFHSAQLSAEKLLADCLRAGESAYPAAAYDIALAHFLLGRVHTSARKSQAALEWLAAARTRFEALATAGYPGAKLMAAAALSESAISLCDLGHLDDSATAYEEAIEQFKELNAEPHIAAAKGRLGMVYYCQLRFDDAYAAHRAAKDAFETLNAPAEVATAWHNIGLACSAIGQGDEAERAYREALAIRMNTGPSSAEASTLGELGNLAAARGRLIEAVTFHGLAADLFGVLQNPAAEGSARTIVSRLLVDLRRFDEARRELVRAMECNDRCGHTNVPWEALMSLHALEHAMGHPEAADAARNKAIAGFLDYRVSGGENHDGGVEFIDIVKRAIPKNEVAKAERELAELATEFGPQAELQTLMPKLHSILHGARDLALAEDPALYYRDVVELRLLLQALQAGSA